VSGCCRLHVQLRRWRGWLRPGLARLLLIAIPVAVPPVVQQLAGCIRVIVPELLLRSLHVLALQLCK
jgi:hypothetical protein